MKLTVVQWLKLAAGVAAVAGFPVALPISAALGAVVTFLGEQKKVLDQNDEWTPEQRAERDVIWAQVSTSHAWLTDSEGGT
jgi:hypothetical protein